MAVPESIRSVPRPKNTVVINTGSNTAKRYAVLERSREIYMPGGNPQPRNGKTIGHIVDGHFVPLAPKATHELHELSYGGSALIRSVTGDLYEDLLKVYDCKEATTIIALASLKVLFPDRPASRMASSYNRTYIRVFYPGASLSRNSIGDLLQRLGADEPKRTAFYAERMKRVAAEHHIIIDGMLKQDTSVVNDLSAWSYKSFLKGCREISILYAYDLDLMEPICAQVFPGNEIDASSYPTFIRDNNITHGIIINDKGFPPSRIADLLKENPDLHFLTPIKRSDARIKNNEMLKFVGTLAAADGAVFFKKAKIKGGHYLYSFMSESKAASEQHAFCARAHKKGLDWTAFEAKRPLFGVVVFESDLDLDPAVVYRAYTERWLLELVFKRYKSDERLDKTCVQGDFTVFGTEFVNFIATTATCRILTKAGTAGLLDELSLAALLDDLSSAWRKVDAPMDETPRRDDPYWVHTLKKVADELEALGLIEPESGKPSVKRTSAAKRSRKK